VSVSESGRPGLTGWVLGQVLVSAWRVHCGGRDEVLGRCVVIVELGTRNWGGLLLFSRHLRCSDARPSRLISSNR